MVFGFHIEQLRQAKMAGECGRPCGRSASAVGMHIWRAAYPKKVWTAGIVKMEQ